jgi:hypothetical protein
VSRRGTRGEGSERKKGEGARGSEKKKKKKKEKEWRYNTSGAERYSNPVS